MLTILKQKLYFPVASYFGFFAKLRLRRWNPRIVVVTGSSGKTTLLHLLEAQLGDKAKYSHHANSSYGIPFDILDLHRKTLRASEWLSMFLKAPLQVFKHLPKQQIYVVEADTDRPGEGKFLAEFLRPEVVLWVSVGRTHGMNFDALVRSPQPPLHKGGRTEGSPPASAAKTGVGGPQDGGFVTVDEAIAYDFGYFLEYCRDLAVINGDLPLEIKQAERTKAELKVIKKKDDLENYKVDKGKTMFTISGRTYAFEALLPEEALYAIAMCETTVNYLGLPFDSSFKHFVLPPGRGTILQGIQQTALIDSSYNANLASMEAMLGMFADFPVKKKWVVLGDMLELGEKEQEEHEKLGEVLSTMDLERVVLVGRRMAKYVYSILNSRGPVSSSFPQVLDLGEATLQRSARLREPFATATPRKRPILEKFENQKDALEYLKENIKGGEAILFKGSQSLFLEGIIEKLLADRKDASKLPRRGEFWEEKRKKMYE